LHPDYISFFLALVLVSLRFVFVVHSHGANIVCHEMEIGWKMLLLISVLSFYPVFVGLLKGQDSFLLIFGGMVCFMGWYAARIGQPGLAWR